jgi:hypothetical protein
MTDNYIGGRHDDRQRPLRSHWSFDWIEVYRRAASAEARDNGRAALLDLLSAFLDNPD